VALKELKSELSLTAPWPTYEQDEIEAVEHVLISGNVNYWTGEEGRKFETEFASYTGSNFSVAMSNGTVALEALLSAIDLKPGDEVIVSPRTFIASVSCVITQGGIPVFADVDRRSGNLSAETIEPKINSHTKAIVVVHLAGWPAEMDEIIALARSNNLFLIEDCAQAHGATYKGRSVGSIGDAGSWSFCQDKIISTAGEGGMVTTNHKDVWSRCWSVKDHGKSYDAIYNKPHQIGFKWVHDSIGSNWRLSEVQSAVGRIQLRKLADWSELRTRNANLLSNGLSGLDVLRLESPPDYSHHAYYKFYAYLESSAIKSTWNRQRILEEVGNRGVCVYSGSCSEVYLEKAIQDLELAPKERLPIAQELGETSLMLLVHPTLQKEQVERAAEIVREVLIQATD